MTGIDYAIIAMFCLLIAMFWFLIPACFAVQAYFDRRFERKFGERKSR